MLCSGVRCLARHGAICHGRCDVDNGAAAKRSSAEALRGHGVRLLCGHQRRDRFREEKSCSSVDVEDAAEVLVGSHVEGYNGIHVNLQIVR